MALWSAFWLPKILLRAASLSKSNNTFVIVSPHILSGSRFGVAKAWADG
jgi:hypothetical protein